MAEPYSVFGLENLPLQGTFVLALNHTSTRWTPRQLATVHLATLQRRPDLKSDWLVVVGYRALRPERYTGWQRKLVGKVRRLIERVISRWDYNCFRLPTIREGVSLTSLREWRARAKNQPSLVFPEGRASQFFREVRPGSGRWLASLGLPVLPVATWWDLEKNKWIIDFGPPVEWTEQSHLQDLQLGLAIANALPPEEAPDWQERLELWEAAHRPEPQNSEVIEEKMEALALPEH